MIKKILLLAIMIASFGVVKATGFKLGLTGGVNMSKLDFKETEFLKEKNFKPGFVIGAKAEVSLSSFLIDASVLYNRKNTEVEEKIDLKNFSTSDLNINSLNIPINVGSKLGIGGIGIYGHTGPSFNINLSGNKKSNSGSESLRFGSSNNDNIKKMTFDWNIGAGVNIKKFQIGLDYQLPLTKENANGDSELKTSNIQLKLAFFFINLDK